MIKLFILKESALYHIDDLDRQIADNPYVTFLLLRMPDYLKHKSQGHFELDSLDNPTYRGIRVTSTYSGEHHVNKQI